MMARDGHESFSAHSNVPSDRRVQYIKQRWDG
jgi:hypothetical protein